MTMVRKQMYVEPEQDAKLKRLAAARGCTEAEVLREAIDKLPEDEPRWLQRARAAGIIVEQAGPVVSAEERDAMRERLYEALKGKKTGILEELLRDRDDRVL